MTKTPLLAAPTYATVTQAARSQGATVRRITYLQAALPLAALMTAVPAQGAAPKNILVSVSSSEAQGGAASSEPSLSGTARYVAFTSEADDLVPHDENNALDVFVRDRQAGKTTRVSVTTEGEEGSGGGYSHGPDISADGRFVVFSSNHTNLVAGDDDQLIDDVFIRDRQTHETTFVSVSSDEEKGTNYSYEPSISANGLYVAFTSQAGNLVASDTNNYDVFVRDIEMGTTSLVDVASNGDQATSDTTGPAISGNGRWVGFFTAANNLVPNDGNGLLDVFVRDLKNDKTILVSVDSNGNQTTAGSKNPSLSYDGRFIAFEGFAKLTPNGNAQGNIYVRDRVKHKTTLISVNNGGKAGNGYSSDPQISSNGRWVAFQSNATNLSKNDDNNHSDIFIRDRKTGKTTRVSVSKSGKPIEAPSENPSISANGAFVGLDSASISYVANDSNDKRDVFLRGPLH